MRHCLVLLLLISNSCIAQKWDAEIMLGLSGYSGDLTENTITTRTLSPAGGFNLKYKIGYIVSLRGGIFLGSVSAHDKFNKRDDLKCRNLSFRSNISEANLCVEVNLLEPEYFIVYPYLFAGVGMFHFNPYTYDQYAHRTYLQPLGTEGQGLAAYPDRKPYRLTQFCLPFGGGIKVNINKKFEVAYELAGRRLFTDYLDDVSKTYVNYQALMANSRPKSAELAYRQTNGVIPNDGDKRGNPKVKDWYYFSGIKVTVRLDKELWKLF